MADIQSPRRAAPKRGVIYVMSGTGNSHRAARWVAETAGAASVPCEVVSMDAAAPERELTQPGPLLVGLCMPTHGFTAPWLAIKFTYRMPRRRGDHAFVIATRASAKLGPWATPGLSGTATLLIALMLALKGYSIRGLLGLDMPSNWIQVHPAFRPETVSFVLGKARPAATQLARDLIAGRRHFPPIGLFYDVVSGLAMLPIAVAYLLFGRLFFGKIFFASDRCDGCGICETSCPVGGVKVLGQDKPRPYWNYHCESCNRCVSYCPRQAIEIGHGFATFLTLISFIPFVPFVMVGAPRWTRWFELFGPWLGSLCVLASWYVLLLGFYPLFYLALKVPWFNGVNTYTAITRLWRRHRDPGTRLLDLVPRDKQVAWKEIGKRRKLARAAAPRA